MGKWAQGIALKGCDSCHWGCGARAIYLGEVAVREEGWCWGMCFLRLRLGLADGWMDILTRGIVVVSRGVLVVLLGRSVVGWSLALYYCTPWRTALVYKMHNAMQHAKCKAAEEILVYMSYFWQFPHQVSPNQRSTSSTFECTLQRLEMSN